MKYFNLIVSISLALLYFAGYIPPTEKFNLWIVPFIIPFALCINIILLLISIAFKKWAAILYVVALLVGSNYIFSTLSLKSLYNSNEAEQENSFSVINYNVSALEITHHTSDKKKKKTADLIQWILQNNADIQCYQEFRNNIKHPTKDLIKKIHDKGYHHYFSFDPVENRTATFGVLIVSRFPILHTGDLFASENGFNRVAYADIKIHQDTVRIIAVHLESMGLKTSNPAYAEDITDGKRKTRLIFHKLKNGEFERSHQIKQLITFIETSPYPVICAGDFNELPYSYSYQLMRKHLKNSFEEKGEGFGFTYNGNTLRMLRIDNQFFSSQLQLQNFKTLHDVSFTDHFPLEGRYKVMH